MTRKSVLRVLLMFGAYLALYGALVMSAHYPALAVLGGFLAGIFYSAVMEAGR